MSAAGRQTVHVATTGQDNRTVTQLVTVMFTLVALLYLLAGLHALLGKPEWTAWAAIADAALILLLALRAGYVALR